MTTPTATTIAQKIGTHVAVFPLVASLLLGATPARAQPAAAPSPGSAQPTPGAPPVEEVPAVPAPRVVGESTSQPVPSGGDMPSAPPPPAPVVPTPPAPPVDAPMPRLPPPSRVPSYILWGVAGASLIVGASFGFAALSAKSDFDDDPTAARADTVHSRAVLADVGIGLGAILAVTGTIFFFAHDSGEAGTHASAPASTHPVTHARVAAPWQVVPLITPNAGGGVISMRF
jgi:hypothetical protein